MTAMVHAQCHARRHRQSVQVGGGDMHGQRLLRTDKLLLQPQPNIARRGVDQKRGGGYARLPIDVHDRRLQLNARRVFRRWPRCTFDSE